jgi:asparagine synthase (glutamine-hydrolysing)
MCGICGFVGHGDEALLRAMTDRLAHRGPDGSGTRIWDDGSRPRTGLGHRRLSIIDPTPRGAQPMSYGNGRYWITYNGELYNFRELKRELVAGGFSFQTETDTEVLLALYARDGARMLERLNGIFAFAIHDDESGELFLARDHLGVKPLYYSQVDGSLYFASELKSLLLTMPARLRPTAVADFLTFLWVPDPETLLEGILKLPPGHYAYYRAGRLELHRYWDLEFAVEERPEAAWTRDVRDTILTAVKRQMVSDVPLGSFLSGGIDSTAIVAGMRAATDKVTTYTVGFDPEDVRHEIVPDDLKYSRLVAEQFDIDYQELILAPDIVDLLPTLIDHLDDPVADTATITTYLICKAASESLTVILSGMGGDEVFAGYPRHLAARIARAADVVPAGLRHRLRTAAEGRLTLGRPGRLRGPRRNLMKLMRGLDASPEERYLVYSTYYRPEELERVLSAEARLAIGDHDPLRYHRDYFGRVRDQHWLNRILYVDAKTFLPCLNLAYTDKLSMAASTEVRVPLLDDEVVALAARIPPSLKLRRLTRKYVFKRSMQGVVPRDVIWRQKAGFGAPLRAWLDNDLRPMVDDLLSPERLRERGLFDPTEVQRLIAANRSGTEDNALRIWTLLTFELWQQRFLDGAQTAAPEAAGAAAR